MEAVAKTKARRGDPRSGSDAGPAIFNVTHWKAGSTWIERILGHCAGERFVRPHEQWSINSLAPHFFEEPIRPDGVYSRVYATREEFERVDLPKLWRRFVVIRDLRDTLISAYFSVKLSHTIVENPILAEERTRLQTSSQEAGLRWMLDHFMVAKSAEIQASWLRSGERLIRYEDLLKNDVRMFQSLLIDECGFPLTRPRVRSIVEDSRFKRMSGGRGRGVEDPGAHLRRGVAGDWKRYLRGPLKNAFKERWGELLVATGYATGLDW